jgi:uncharacterized membrane protein
LPDFETAIRAGMGVLFDSFAGVGIDDKFTKEVQSSEAREGVLLICDAYSSKS